MPPVSSASSPSRLPGAKGESMISTREDDEETLTLDDNNNMDEQDACMTDDEGNDDGKTKKLLVSSFKNRRPAGIIVPTLSMVDIPDDESEASLMVLMRYMGCSPVAYGDQAVLTGDAPMSTKVGAEFAYDTFDDDDNSFVSEYTYNVMSNESSPVSTKLSMTTKNEELSIEFGIDDLVEPLAVVTAKSFPTSPAVSPRKDGKKQKPNITVDTTIKGGNTHEKKTEKTKVVASPSSTITGPASVMSSVSSPAAGTGGVISDSLLNKYLAKASHPGEKVAKAIAAVHASSEASGKMTAAPKIIAKKVTAPKSSKKEVSFLPLPSGETTKASSVLADTSKLLSTTKSAVPERKKKKNTKAQPQNKAVKEEQVLSSPKSSSSKVKMSQVPSSTKPKTCVSSGKTGTVAASEIIGTYLKCPKNVNGKDGNNALMSPLSGPVLSPRGIAPPGSNMGVLSSRSGTNKSAVVEKVNDSPVDESAPKVNAESTPKCLISNNDSTKGGASQQGFGKLVEPPPMRSDKENISIIEADANIDVNKSLLTADTEKPEVVLPASQIMLLSKKSVVEIDKISEAREWLLRHNATPLNKLETASVSTPTVSERKVMSNMATKTILNPEISSLLDTAPVSNTTLASASPIGKKTLKEQLEEIRTKQRDIKLRQEANKQT